MNKKTVIVALILLGVVGFSIWFLGHNRDTGPKYKATNLKTGSTLSLSVNSTELTSAPVSYVGDQNNELYSFDKADFALIKVNIESGKRTVLMDGLNLNVANLVWSPDKSKAILTFYNDHATEYTVNTPFNEWGNLLVDLSNKNTTELSYQFRNIKWINDGEIIYKNVVEDQSVLYTVKINDLSSPRIIGSVSEEDDYLPTESKIFIAALSTDASPVTIRSYDRQSGFSKNLDTFKNFSGWQLAADDFVIVKDGSFKFYRISDLSLVASLETEDFLSVTPDGVYLLKATPTLIQLDQYLPTFNKRLPIAEFTNVTVPQVSSFSVQNSILILNTEDGLVKLKF